LSVILSSFSTNFSCNISRLNAWDYENWKDVVMATSS